MSPRRAEKRRRPSALASDRTADRTAADAVSTGRTAGAASARGVRDHVGGERGASELATVCDVEVQSIAAGGDGVARIDGRVIFVPRTAPGDQARIRATTVRGGRFARGVLLDLLRPSADRVPPECVHYVRDRCGGCQLQHLRYPSQLLAKGLIVRDALVRIAHRAVAEVLVDPSPRQWRYRRKLTLTMRRGSGSGGWVAGLRQIDAPDSIFALEDCAITDEGVVAVWRAIMRVAEYLPDSASLRGAVRTIAGGYAFHLEGGAGWDTCQDLRAAVPALTEVWWTPERGARRRMDGAGSGGGASRSADRTGASFAQVNADVGDALHADVVGRAMSHDPRRVIDAYAGTGATAVALARRGVAVVAIEMDRAAAAVCAAAMPAGSRAVTARVEDALSGALPADVIVLNPPRTGVAAAVTAALREVMPRPKALVYVSCDPATLARDVDRLPGWRVVALRAFDMFPQTAHVETVCELVPETAAQ